LFRGDDVFKPTKVLSGGEKGRLGLARVLVQNANFLLLDEPTNHLDMTSVEALTAAIEEYQGTVLCVSHDRTFINNIATHIFAMIGDGRSMLFEGGLEDYGRLARKAGFPNVLDPDEQAERGKTPAAQVESGKGQQVGRGDFKEMSRRVDKLERLIQKESATLEALKSQLAETDTALLAVSPTDFAKLELIHSTRSKLEEQIDAAELQWLEYAEEKEQLERDLTQR
jgi:ATP-binding cassette subfamily F protein 3